MWGEHDKDNKNPCRKCHEEKQSYEGCHGKCEKYIEWKKEHDKNRMEIIKKKNDDCALGIYKRDAKRKYYKLIGR